MSKDTPLNLMANWTELQKVRQLAYNAYGVDLFGITESVSDTTFSYSLHAKGKLNKAERETIRAFCVGVIACVKSY